MHKDKQHDQLTSWGSWKLLNIAQGMAAARSSIS